MKIYAFLFLALFLSGCATTRGTYSPPFARPIVDMAAKGFDPVKYTKDSAECQQLAAGTGTSGLGEAAAGALLGTMIGLALGADLGGPAALGAIGGFSGGAARGVEATQSAMTRCMTGRGYTVLGFPAY